VGDRGCARPWIVVSDHLVALTGPVEELAGLLAEAVPGPEAEALRRHAHELASRAS
jgi:hypothetical protein